MEKNKYLNKIASVLSKEALDLSSVKNVGKAAWGAVKSHASDLGSNVSKLRTELRPGMRELGGTKRIVGGIAKNIAKNPLAQAGAAGVVAGGAALAMGKKKDD